MLILASTSPRRKEILEFFSVPFKQFSPPFDENTISYEGDPKSYVSKLSHGKALSASKENPNQIVIAADTVVYFDGEVLEKPKNKEHAFEMLKKLQGNWHQVYTAVSVIHNEHSITDYDETNILFKDCSDSEIKNYIDKLSPLDKAGSYAIQGCGNIMIEKLDGCFYNTMGLPINVLERALKVIGFSLWDFLKK